MKPNCFCNSASFYSGSLIYTGSISNPACETDFTISSGMGFAPSTVRILSGLLVSTLHFCTLASASRKGVTARTQLAQLMLVLNFRVGMKRWF